jgi:predicted phosphodiesterase
MKFLVIATLFSLAVATVILFWGVPVITGRGAEQVKEALQRTKTIELFGKTLFISDLHLTAEPALDKQFNLDFSDVQNVIIVGDFFNHPKDFAAFGNTEEESLRSVLGEIVPEGFSGTIFFLASFHSHDPRLEEVTQLQFENFEFIYLGEYGKFSINGKQKVIAFHGGQLHEGIVGGGVAWLAKKFGQEVPLEKLGKKYFGIDKHTWVINGHSHVPGIDQSAKAANTGSFVGAPFNKFIFRLHIGTGILFDGDRVELQEYEDVNLKKLYFFAL